MDGEGDNVKLLKESVFSPPAEEQMNDLEQETKKEQGKETKEDQEKEQSQEKEQETKEEQEFVEPESLESGAYPNAIQPIQEGGFLPFNIAKRYTVSSFFSNKEVSDIFEKKGKLVSATDRSYLPSLFSLKNDFKSFTKLQQTTPVYILNALSIKLAALITDDQNNFEIVKGTITSTPYRKDFATYDTAKRTEIWTLVETIVRLYLVVYMCQKHASTEFIKEFGNNKISSIEITCEKLLIMFDKINPKPADPTLEDDIENYHGIFYTYRAGETILTLLTDIGRASLAEESGIEYLLIDDSGKYYYFPDMFAYLEYLVHQTTPPSGTGISTGTAIGIGTAIGTGTAIGIGSGSVPGPTPFVRRRIARLTGLRVRTGPYPRHLTRAAPRRGGGTRKLGVRKNNNTLKSQ